MITDFLVSKDGLRIDHVDLSVSGVRFARSAAGGLVPRSADAVEGAIRLTLTDLGAAVARPEILDQLLTGLSGLARPELSLAEADDGSIRIVGSIELLGRRFPVSAHARLSVQDERVVLSASRFEGVPMLAALADRAPTLALPLVLPAGLHFTDVRTVDGAVVVGFAGTDVVLGADTPVPRPETPPAAPPTAPPTA